ncbi:Rieske (2Fe-2S) protein [Belnapia rosea]|uniref:3-phenylpropionate/trans-cinnamate dioxygenase ferredoxin subunit n=1 Tax=Belnapia rosea TaxID=938405 RepID=A0A1G6VH59_9PROT|nr:Rieske 2Fe-2S domain-containing protein [Belnapia rosea]SDB38252.1 3-phenylpropionate/trans-cinnamate dioxygenase ferredoxin subunit [Belnapia rosea]SDD52387.1 3-phenylpropionate/trans-cinnamate dioxygenase ferredoxin subunit [Belnapia rosea]
MARHVVAAVGEIPPNGRKLVEVKGRRIALFHVSGEYFALTDRCPHEGGSLCAGRLTGLVRSNEPGRYEYSRPQEMLACSWHGWEFDIRTGQSYCDPESIRARIYPVSLEPGEALTKGPFVAETFPVSVDGQYILVEV